MSMDPPLPVPILTAEISVYLVKIKSPLNADLIFLNSMLNNKKTFHSGRFSSSLIKMRTQFTSLRFESNLFESRHQIYSIEYKVFSSRVFLVHIALLSLTNIQAQSRFQLAYDVQCLAA